MTCLLGEVVVVYGVGAGGSNCVERQAAFRYPMTFVGRGWGGVGARESNCVVRQLAFSYPMTCLCWKRLG